MLWQAVLLSNRSSPLCFFSSRRRHTRYIGDWSSDVCSSDLFTAGAGNADFDSGILLRQTGELRCIWWPARTEGGVSWGPARGAVERAAQCFRRGALSGRQHRVAGVVSSHMPRAEQPDLLRVVAPGDAA